MEFFLNDSIYKYRQILNPSENQLEFIYDIEIINDEIFVGTNLGLFKGNFIDFILNYPNNWMSTNELSNQTIRKIMNKNDNIYLSSDNEIFMLDQYSVFKSNFFLNEDIFIIDYIIDNDGKSYIVSKWKLYEVNKN